MISFGNWINDEEYIQHYTENVMKEFERENEEWGK